MHFVSIRSTVYSFFRAILIIILIFIVIHILAQRTQLILNTRKISQTGEVTFEKWWLGDAGSCWQQYAGWLYQLPDCSSLEVGEKIRLIGSPAAMSDNDQFQSKRLEIRSFEVIEFRPGSVNAWISKGIEAIVWTRGRIQRIWLGWLGYSGGSLVYSLWFGGRSILSKRLDLGLENLGLSYVVSVSGMHVGLLRSIYGKKSDKLPIGSKLALEMAVLGAFGSLALWRPGVLRAAVMTSWRLLGRYLGGRPIFAPTLVVGAVVLCLLLQPLLFFSVGFWLSAAATLGIVWWQLWQRRRNQFGMWEMGDGGESGRGIGQYLKDAWQYSLAAQIALLPILINSFGKVSWVGLAASAAVLWLLPWLFRLGSWLLVVSMVRMVLYDGGLAALALDRLVRFGLLPARVFLLQLSDLIRSASAANWMQIEFSAWSTTQIIVWYLAWLIGIALFSRRK